MRRALLNEATARAAAYLDGLETRAVVPTEAAIAALAALNEPLPVPVQLEKLNPLLGVAETWTLCPLLK